MLDIVRTTAESLKLLTPAGQLEVLDSLNLVSFVTALEEATGKRIPSSAMHNDNFVSLESVAALLAELD